MRDKNILNSWKEIASYLGRAERTCRRWEIEFDLPVYRMDGSLRASVFAYKEELDRWLDELLHQKKIPPRNSFFSQRKFIIVLGLSIILIAVLAVVGWKILSPKPGVSLSAGNPSLAIFYFRNKTEDESLDDWRKALCGLLISDLAQSRYLNVLPEDRLFYILQNLRLLDAEYYDPKDLAKFADSAQVNNIVIGNVVREGNKLRVDATLIKIPSGESIHIESVDCKSKAEAFSLVDEISKRVKAQLVFPPNMIVGDIDEEIENITTSSIEAFGYYGKGRQLFRRGQVSESVSLLEKAVGIDPDFAAAYRMMAMCYEALPGYEEKAKDCLERAFALRHRVSERERLQIQAQYSSSQGEMGWDEAIKALRELLQIYPDDYLSICDLGNLYRQIEDYDSSIETLQKIVHVYYINDHFAWLRRAFCARGNYDEALKLAKSIPVDLWPAQYPYQLTLNLFLLGKFDLALYEAEKILARSEDWYPVLRLKGDIHLAKEEWALAEDCYNKWLEARDLEINRLKHHNMALARLASLNLFKGRFDEAISYIKRGIREVSDLGERRWLDFFRMHLAYIYYKKGDIKETEGEYQNALGSALENASIRTRVSALRHKGVVALEKGISQEPGHYSVGFRDVWFNGCKSYCYLGGEGPCRCWVFSNYSVNGVDCCEPLCCGPTTECGSDGFWVMQQYMETSAHPRDGYDHFGLRFWVNTDIESIEAGDTWTGQGYMWWLNIWNTGETLLTGSERYHNIVCDYTIPLEGVQVYRPGENEWIITIDQCGPYVEGGECPPSAHGHSGRYIVFWETYYQGIENQVGKSGKSKIVSEYRQALGGATRFKFQTRWTRTQ